MSTKAVPSFSIDGQSMGSSAPKQLTAPEANVTYELNELKRKLEIKEGDIKRKQRELLLRQDEVLKAQKEIKSLVEEVQTVRDRNELLQQSLTTARATIASQSSQLEEASEINKSVIRVKDLESSLQDATKTIARMEGELIQFRNTASQRDSTKEMDRLRNKLDAAKKSEESAKTEVFDMQFKLDRIQADNGSLNTEIETVRRLLATARNQASLNAEACGKQDKTLMAKDSTIEELLTENERMKSSLRVRNETNASLRVQIEELHIQHQTKEMNEQERERLALLERENAALKKQSSDLNVEAEGKGTSLLRIEQEKQRLKKQLDSVTSTLSAHALEIQQHIAAATAYKSELKGR